MCRTSDSSYNSTDSSLIIAKYFLPLELALNLLMWHTLGAYYIIVYSRDNILVVTLDLFC